MRKLDKKGQVFGTLSQVAGAVATVAIVLIVTFLIIATGRDEIERIEGLNGSEAACDTSLACNSTSRLQESVDIIPSFMSIVVIAGVGAALLGLVALFQRRRA